MRRIVLLLICLMRSSSAAAGSTGIVHATAEDAWVSRSNPTATHPSSALLFSGAAGASDVQRSFVQFRLPSHGRVLSALLKGGYEGSASSAGGGVHAFDFVADDGWSPATVTWQNQPAASERIATVDTATLSQSREMELDVTSLVQREQAGDRAFSLRIAPVDESPFGLVARWAARESDSRRGFHLELVVSPGPRLEAGDVVTLSRAGLYSGVVGFGTDGLLERIAPVRFVHRLHGLARDPSDGSWITADTEGIVRIDPARGNPTPISAGSPTGVPSLYVAVAADRSIYVLEPDIGPSIVRVDPDTGLREDLSAGGELCLPAGMAVDGTSLLVADRCGKLIRISMLDGTQSLVALDRPLLAPESVALDSDGTILLAETDGNASGTILRIDPSDGSTTAAASLSFAPGPIAVDPTGTIWVGSQPDYCSELCNEAAIGRIDPVTGAYRSIFHSFDALGGLAVDSDGTPLAALSAPPGEPRLVRFDPTTGAERVIAAPITGFPQSFDEVGLVVDASRRLYAVRHDRIVEIDVESGEQTLMAGPAEMACDWMYCMNRDVAVAPDGRIGLLRTDEFAPFGFGRITWIDPRTGSRTDQDLGVRPHRFVVAPDGTIFAAIDWFEFVHTQSIVRIDPHTGAETVVSSGLPLRRLDDLAIDRSGTLFVAEKEDGRIVRVDPSTGVAEVSVTADRPERLAVDSAGRFVDWSDRERLYRVDPTTGERGTLATRVELTANLSIAYVAPRCSNGVDDDGDGRIDFPADTQCRSAGADSESAPCSNGRDDDGDGQIDLDDPQCTSPSGSESACGVGVELALALATVGLARRRARRAVS